MQKKPNELVDYISMFGAFGLNPRRISSLNLKSSWTCRSKSWPRFFFFPKTWVRVSNWPNVRLKPLRRQLQRKIYAIDPLITPNMIMHRARNGSWVECHTRLTGAIRSAMRIKKQEQFSFEERALHLDSIRASLAKRLA